jgi:hypothetical protein
MPTIVPAIFHGQSGGILRTHRRSQPDSEEVDCGDDMGRAE